MPQSLEVLLKTGFYPAIFCFSRKQQGNFHFVDFVKAPWQENVKFTPSSSGENTRYFGSIVAVLQGNTRITMKILLALLMFLTPFVASAEIPDDVANAIRTGNAKEISKYFADNVDLKVLEQENIYSKAQAELILKDFFAKHPVKEFALVHKSQPKNDSQFAIGTLKTYEWSLSRTLPYENSVRSDYGDPIPYRELR